MTLINIELYEALLSAKVPKDKARAAAAGVMPSDQVATKADLKTLEKTLEARLTWRMITISGGFSTLTIAVITLVVTLLIN